MPPADSPHAATVMLILTVLAFVLTSAAGVVSIARWFAERAEKKRALATVAPPVPPVLPQPRDREMSLDDVQQQAADMRHDALVEARLRSLEQRVAEVEAHCAVTECAPRRPATPPPLRSRP